MVDLVTLANTVEFATNVAVFTTFTLQDMHYGTQS